MVATAMSFSAGVVMELTDQRIDKVNKEIKVPNIGNLWPVRWVVVIFDWWFIPRMEQLTRGVTDDAIWFKGVAKELWDANEDVRQSAPLLLSKLQRSQEQILKTRKESLDLMQEELASPAFKQAVTHMLEASVDLFDSIEAFRWTLMELEANHSPRSEGWVATTPEGVEELFRRIQQEE
ncbi:MAG: hypothetical protein IPH35_11295 [Rhodoferax sp.]|nr:hypothetical protein [Rhodoferax sp.]